MIKKLFILLIVLILPVLIIGPFLSTNWQARGEYTFMTNVVDVHRVIGNLETWPKWEPWMSNDPKTVFKKVKGVGVGAQISWTSETGNGSLLFTKVNALKGIEYNFEFEGFPPATASFEYIVKEGRVKVVWTMNGESDVPVIGGYLAYMVQGMISKNLNEGLENVDKLLKGNK